VRGDDDLNTRGTRGTQQLAHVLVQADPHAVGGDRNRRLAPTSVGDDDEQAQADGFTQVQCGGRQPVAPALQGGGDPHSATRCA